MLLDSRSFELVEENAVLLFPLVVKCHYVRNISGRTLIPNPFREKLTNLWLINRSFTKLLAILGILKKLNLWLTATKEATPVN